MGTKQYDSATDLLTFSRASGGTALSKISYGNELVTNGDFSSGTTGWVDGTQWSGALDASSGKLLITSDSSNGYGCAIQGVPLVVGKAYRLTGSRRAVSGGNPAIGLSMPSGAVQVILLSGSASTVTNDFSVTFVASSTYSLCLFNQSPTNGNSSEFDNISVKEVLFGQSDGTLQLYNYPNNVPRIEYDAAGAVKGLLIEEARTNLVIYSNDFTTSSWTRHDVSIASNVSGVTAPDGSETVDKMIPNSSNNEHRVWDGVSSTAVGETYSVYAKSAGYDYVWLGYYEDFVYGYAVVNLTNGVVTASNTANYSVEASTNGFYRISVTKTTSGTNPRYISISPSPTASPTLNSNNVPSFVGDGTSGIYVWGAQIEAGAFPTSYIPTTGAAATRARDLAEIPTSAFGYNNDKGSLVIDVLMPDVDQFMTLATFNISSYFNSRGLWKVNNALNGAGDYFVFQTFDGVVTNSVFGQQTQAGYTKLGLSYGDSERSVINGGTVVSGTSRYPNPTRLHLGGRDNGYQSQCWIKSIQYYPRRLTNTQLQEITAAGSSLRAYALGNSTVGPYSGQPSIISLVTTSNTKVNVAVPGDTIAEQKADWNSLSVNSLGTAWVVLQVGLNDLNPALGTTASKIAEIQDLVDTIKADIGSKPLYIAKMLPCKQRIVDVYGATAALSQQRWVDMNEAIAGNGSSPITGVQGRIVSHVPLMDDGLGNLKAVYDLGDHIHPNTAGRQVMATAWEGFTT